MRRAVLSVLLAVVFYTTTSAKLPWHAESIRPLMSGEQGICTTWSLNRVKGYWVTAAHCVEYWAEVDEALVLLPRENLRIAGKVATVVQKDSFNDLALLRADEHAPALHLGRYPHVGDEVTAYGYPGGWGAPFATWLRVSNAYFKPSSGAQAKMVLQGTLWPGHSGCPLLDSKAQVIGVGQWQGSDRWTNLTLVSAWTDLHAFIAGFEED